MRLQLFPLVYLHCWDISTMSHIHSLRSSCRLGGQVAFCHNSLLLMEE